MSDPINLTGKLIVIDGRNSSGKTSLAEAFEWLLSGQLIRRSLGDRETRKN
ncbi:MAG: AAA family ATPase [Anaerolineales bacterium]|nr:AAA family ATPase [Anaerolineales bacterium]